MILATCAFYIFSIVAIISALFVVFSRNPVHSVLWLILTFFSVAALFILLKAEFIAMLMLIVYVGAVAVLFLFVVMMLGINFSQMKQSVAQYFPLVALVAVIMVLQLGMVVGVWQFSDSAPVLREAAFPESQSISNTKALGQVIYTDFVLVFQISGLILLVAMIGAIVLTLRQRPGVRKQDVLKQIYRTREESVSLKNVKPGQGV